MTSICLPAPLFLILRRLFNVFYAFSISHGYLASRGAGKIGARASEGPSESSNDAWEMGNHDVQGGELAEWEKNKNKELQKNSADESAWSLLNRLKKALPTKEQGDHAAQEKELDAVAELRRRHLQDLAMKPQLSDSPSPIHRLISNPQLFDPVRSPRHPIVLCHGLYGFDVRGPEAFPKLRMHYWSNVLHVLRKKVGAEVVVTGVPGTGSIASRAERMDRFLKEKVPGRDINFLAHSMGGLDCRHLITHIQPREYRPMSLTSLSVPHQGSPFMDWCLANIGIGSPRPFPFPSTSSQNNPTSTTFDGTASSTMRAAANNLPYSLRAPLLSRPPATRDGSASSTLDMLPSSLRAMVLSLIDSPAYANLTTGFLRDIFNPSTPDKADVKYFSVAARTSQMSIWHPLWLPKLIVDAAEEQEAYSKQGEISPRPSQAAPETSSQGRGIGITRQDESSGLDGFMRGNDGLVTISSAKWGTFLGIIEGCDHWELRGARGLGAELEEGWGEMWREWIGKWRDSGTAERDGIWSFLGGEGVSVGPRDGSKEKKATGIDWVTRNELGSKFDLERFYVALSRKLYDEGL